MTPAVKSYPNIKMALTEPRSAKSPYIPDNK